MFNWTLDVSSGKNVPPLGTEPLNLPSPELQRWEMTDPPSMKVILLHLLRVLSSYNLQLSALLRIALAVDSYLALGHAPSISNDWSMWEYTGLVILVQVGTSLKDHSSSEAPMGPAAFSLHELLCSLTSLFAQCGFPCLLSKDFDFKVTP